MKKYWIICVMGVSLLINNAFASALQAEAASEPSRPVVLSFGGLGAGSLMGILTQGIAKVVGDNTPIRPKVQAFTSYMQTFPLIESGELDIGITVSTEGYYAWRGMKPYRKLRNIRLLSAGAGLATSYIVRRDSEMRTMADTRGKRVGIVTTIPTMQLWGEALLKVAGIDPTTAVTVVPAANVAEPPQALADGRIEVAQANPTQPQVRRVDAQIGVRFLPAATNDQQAKQLLGMLPGFRMVTYKKGRAPGILEETPFVFRPIYLLVGKHVPDEAVYATVEAIWEHQDQLIPIHPMFRGWTHKSMVAGDAGLPYHEGTVRFFKEKGVWTAHLDQLQQQLLNQ